MEDFVLLATTQEIPAEGMKAVSLDGRDLLVVHAKEDYFVVDAKCPHMGGQLQHGTVEGTIVTCPRHHSQFDLRDGRVVRWTDWKGPGLSVAKLFRQPRALRTYAVRIDGDRILVGPEKTPPEES